MSGGRQCRARGSWRRDPELQGRDIDILKLVTRHGVVTVEQIGWAFFWRPETKAYGVWACDRRLKALARLGLILRDENPFATRREKGGPEDLLRVSRKGAELVRNAPREPEEPEIKLRPAPLVIHDVPHSIAVVALTQILLDDNPGGKLTTERELRARRYRELRSGESRPTRGRIPDALLRVPTSVPGVEETVAVELDLSRKDRSKMEDMVRAYDRVRVDRVWWYVAKERVDRTRQLVRRMKADNRMEVRAWLG